MRIGIDCRLWNETGVGRYTRNLVKYLQILDKKNEYVLFVRNKDKENIQFQISNFKFQIKEAEIRWHTLEEQVKFPKILNKEKLELMHFPYFSVPVFYNKPFVITIHDLILHSFSTGEASTLPLPLYKAKLLGYKFVITKAAKKAEKIIVPTVVVKEDVLKRLGVPEKKVEITYEGIDDSISSKLKKIAESYFLYVGNAYPHKNLNRLIQAFKMFNKKSSEIKLVLVGKEDYFYNRLKDKFKEMGESVIFYGYATDEELGNLYKNALALVAPSLMEGFGLTALEAMKSKCPVLCSNIPAFKEVCRNSAIYFDPYNIEEIKEKMELIVAGKNDFNKNIDKGYARSEEFSWEKMAQKTLKIYESSLSL